MNEALPAMDLLGRPLTALEKQVATLHQAVTALLRTPDLPPCIAANAAHALACTWQMMNNLDLPVSNPEDEGPV